MSDLVLRFLIGGMVVSLFALISDILRPRSFAGIFGAAPSIALATLGLTIMKEGPQYASIEARSMVLGAIGFLVYATCVCRLLARSNTAALVATVGFLPVWAAVSFSLWFLLVRSSS